MSNPGRSATAAARPFGIRDKIGYLFGDFGNDFTFHLSTVFFLVFYTDIMGINAAHVGTLLLVARLLDAFTDVGMGRLIDVLRPTKNGRFRPWIARMCVPVAVAGVMMFMPFVVDASYTVRVVYMTITYLLWGSVCYTSINIPYGSMAAAISDRPDHRASLSVFRALGGQLAFLFIASVLPPLVFVDNKIDVTRMTIAALLCGAAAIICYVICYVNVQERIVVVPNKEEKASFGKMLATVGRNRALLTLVGAALCFIVATQLTTATTSYLWKDWFREASYMSIAQIAASTPVLLFAGFATAVAMRWGKKEISVIGMASAGVISVVMWFLNIHSPIFFIALFFLMNIGIAVFNIVIWAILTDVLDYQEVMSGERDDGTIYAIYSWSRKLGQALAGFIAGQAVAAVGYSSEIAKAGGEQSASTLNGIYLLFLLVPGILFLVTAAILKFGYPLGRKQVQENYETLRARHAADPEVATAQ